MIGQYLTDQEKTTVECQESQRGEGVVNELSGQCRAGHEPLAIIIGSRSEGLQRYLV